jgi:acyl-CoA synthetase (AMP-forming)/AMP-acid ligase II
MLKSLFDHPRFNEFELSSLRRIIYSDSPISPTLRGRVMRALPFIDLFQAYGLTEMGPLVALLRPEDLDPGVTLLQQSNLLGRPMVGVEVRIVDEQFNPLAPGEIGRIIAKSNKRPAEDELVEHCKTALASYKCPTSISFRQEPMPLSAVGKVLKSELRKTWLEGC